MKNILDKSSRQFFAPSFLVLAVTLSCNAATAAQDTVAIPAAGPVEAAKKMISHDVYANWRSIHGNVLSRDGQWAAYALVGQESDGEVVVKNLVDAREWRSPRGTAPVFSFDGKYLAFAIAPTRAELDKAKKEKKKGDDLPKSGMGFIDLATGKVERVERVKRFAFPEEGASLLAVLLEPQKELKKAAKKDEPHADALSEDQQAVAAAGTSPAPKKKEAGTELIVWNLVSGQQHRVKDIADVLWNKAGTVLAYTLSVKEAEAEKPKNASEKKDSEDQQTSSIASAVEKKEATTSTANTAGNEGVYLYTPSDQQTRPILKGAGSYKHLRFDETGKLLAFLTNRDDVAQKKIANEEKEKAGKKEKKPADGTNSANASTEPGIFSLYLWHDGSDQSQLLVNAESKGMPKTWAPSEHAELRFSLDGQRLFLSTAEMQKVDAKDAPEAMKVDLWHWKDPELQSMQKVNAEKDKQKSYRALVHLVDGTFVQLATKNMPQLIVNENAHYAMGISSQPYRQLMSWDSLYYDGYAVDLRNGQAKMLFEKSLFMPHFSPAGKYIIRFDADKLAWFSYATSDGKKTDLTSKIKTHFENRQRDTPEPKDAFGIAGWNADDASVVLYDQFDLWEVKIENQQARNLSNGFGYKNQLEMRYVHLGDDKTAPSKVALPNDMPWMLAATHDVNSSTGYYHLNYDVTKTAMPQRLIHADKLINGVIKAKNSDTILFAQQSFTEFSDLWTSNTDFTEPKKISAANPQQVRYNWGTQELIEYTNADGKKLHALLAKPENFDPKKKYPMMVYIYEKMSDNLHKYVPPAPAQNINVTRYVSNGYIVLRPDIVYKTGYPGRSALNAVVPAVQQVIAKGFVDPKRVGIQGHSWGAYQINYLITHTNIFRAVEAGASMANMVSGYGGIRWGTGMSRSFQYEKQQSRIGGTPWDSTAKYVENSPIFSIDKVKTPYLTVHNDDDDAVPWYQAIEFFTALRRLNKEAYWFNYNGEKHGLRERDNIKHFTVHMSEFFDHYLLEKPRPEWMDKPVPYLERGKRDVMGQFKPTLEQK